MKKARISKGMATLLVLCLLLANLPTAAFASELTDIPNDWSKVALENAVSNGLLKGDNGKIMPKENLTRAQMAAVVNRAFGTTEKVSLSKYTDVAVGAWYYDDMAKAVQMKIFMGSGDKLKPDDYITREEAFVVLARAFKLSGAPESALNKFIDNALVSQWAKDGVASLVSAGYIAGSNGKLNTKQYITRAEFAQIMDNHIKKYIKTSGTYSTDFTGNIMINVPNVTLKNITVTGDLIIGDGVGNGEVILDNVVVIGRTVVRGGGVNSIKIIGNSNLQNIVIARVDGQVRVYSEDGAEIGEVIVDGNDDVIIEGNVGALTVSALDVTVTVSNANIASITIEGENSTMIVGENSTIDTITIEAKNAAITTSAGSKIVDIVVNTDGANISGTGEVEKVAANANNIAVTTSGTSVAAASGTTGVTAGTTTVNAGSTVTVADESTVTVIIGTTGGGDENPRPPPAVAVTGISVSGSGDATEITTDNGTLQMLAAVSPTDATNKAVTWSVENGSGSATISQTGLLTAVTNGTVTVKATSVSNGSVSGTKVITLSNQLITITTAAITEVTAPVIGATPVSTIADTTEYMATIAWSPTVAADATFAASTVYTATITITPKPGYTLTGVPANFFTVTGATATNAAGSGVVTAVFPATADPTVSGHLYVYPDTYAPGDTKDIYLNYYPGESLTDGTVTFQLPDGFTADTEDRVCLSSGASYINLVSDQISNSGRTVELKGLNLVYDLVYGGDGVELNLCNNIIPAEGIYIFSATADADGDLPVKGSSSGTGDETEEFIPAPAPIDDLRAIAGNETITLTFSKSADATEVILQQSLDGVNYTTEAGIMFDASSVTLTDLSNGTPYFFKLIVTGGVHNGTSNIVLTSPTLVCATTSEVTLTPSLTPGSTSRVTVTLNDNNGSPITTKDVFAVNVLAPIGATYTLNGDEYTGLYSYRILLPTPETEGGVSYFDIILPPDIGFFRIQVEDVNGYNIGTHFYYSSNP